MSSLVTKSFHGLLWSAIERFSLQGVQFLIGIVLARLLSPSDFGMIGMLSVFMGVSQTFIDCGFSSALIRQKEVSAKDYGTTFLINFFLSLLVFLILFFIAPFIAKFYNTPELELVIQVFSVTLIINALFTVHVIKLTRNVDFKTQSKASICSAIISGAVGIIFAYNGFGVWSLIILAICNSTLNLILLSFLIKWFPFPTFSQTSFSKHNFFRLFKPLQHRHWKEIFCNNIRLLHASKPNGAIAVTKYRRDFIQSNIPNSFTITGRCKSLKKRLH